MTSMTRRIGRMGAMLALTVALVPFGGRAALQAQQKDIVDTAVAAGSFKTLAAALKAAGLVDTLKGKGPFTVFAPTDEAFAKLPPGTLESLLKPENKQKLTEILTYHVVPGSVMAADVAKMQSAKTVNGKSVTIKADGWQRDDRRRQGREDRHRGVERRHSRHRQRHPAEVVVRPRHRGQSPVTVPGRTTGRPRSWRFPLVIPDADFCRRPPPPTSRRAVSLTRQVTANPLLIASGGPPADLPRMVRDRLRRDPERRLTTTTPTPKMTIFGTVRDLHP